MLHELVVDNLGVIEHGEIVLGPGVTALTGETGAGKTLVTEAINLLLGGRADPALVRPGALEAQVQGRFVLSDDTELVVRRVLPAGGRSRAYIDGEMATAGALADAVAPLVDVHGQHGHQAMLRSGPRRDALDRFGGHDLGPLERAGAELAQARDRLDELGGDEIARTREIELLRYQLDEISAAGLDDPDEDTKLAAVETVLGDAEAHGEAADHAVELLGADGPAGSAIGEALAGLRERAPFQPHVERLYALQAELVDLVEELRVIGAGIEADPQKLVEIQNRRELLAGLRRKYGAELATVIQFGADAQRRLDELENHGELAAELGAEIERLTEVEADAAAALAAARQATAPDLAARVESELRDLALPAASISVTVEGQAGEQVDFEVAMNPGLPMLPVAKAASGGELSRIMLALQLVVGGQTPTVIFDEVDAGVGGEAATSIGAALAGVGRDHQVLVVTHLPQVAACADRQINIVKSSSDATTVTELHELDFDGRIVELARMLSGSPDSEAARAHAAELLAAASS